MAGKGLKEKDTKNISLVGFMGSGKSTVGKILAERLNFLFIDTDRIIELADNRSITEIFKEEGELYFRDVESEVIGKIYPDNRNCVFSCGGGVVLREKNMQIINSHSYVVYLHITPEKAYERLKDVDDRPLLETKNRDATIRNLIETRKKLYLKYADLVIENLEKDPDMIAGEIIDNIKAAQ